MTRVKRRQNVASASVTDERNGADDECVSECVQGGKGRKLG